MNGLRRGGMAVVFGLVLVSTGVQAAQFERTVLDNGLVVIVSQNPATDLAGVFVGLRVGADAETEGRYPARALLQDHDRAYLAQVLATEAEFRPSYREFQAARGIRFQTEWDYVHLQAHCTPQMLELLLKLVARVVFGDPLSPQLVQAARERLQTHYSAAQAQVSEQTYYLFRRAMLGETPAGRPVYGDPQSMATVTGEELAAFRQRFWTPDNGVIVIVSPHPVEEMGRLVQQYFGAYPQGPALSPVSSGRQPVRESDVHVAGNAASELAHIVLGVALPPPGTQEFAVGQILHEVLAGRRGRLRRDPLLLRSLALNLPFELLAQRFPVQALPVSLEAHPHLAIYAQCDPNEALEPTKQALLQQLESFRDGSIRPDELIRARRRVINHMALTTQRPLGMAERLGQYEMLGLDYTLAGPAAVRAVTIDDITESARTYFAEHYVGVMLPERGATANEAGSEPGREDYD